MGKGKRRRSKKKRLKNYNSRLNKLNKKKRERLDAWVSAAFMLGLMLMLWEISIYNDTLIRAGIPWAILLFPGLILTPVFYNKFNEIEGKKDFWLFQYVLHTCIAGSFILFLFMATNYYFSGFLVETTVCRIIKRGVKSLEDEGEVPYGSIRYHGMERDIIFPGLEEAEL